MSKIEFYRAELEQLRGIGAWDAYLRAHSGLPGPRGNLELAHAFAAVAPAEIAWACAVVDAESAPTNTPGEFVAFCGVLALGPLAARGDSAAAPALRRAASDERWRVREAVATALQLWADTDATAVLALAQVWSAGTRYEQRAAVAGVAEPRFLKSPDAAAGALALVDSVTGTIVGAADARTAPFRVLRQALGYAWSVIVVGKPVEGRVLFAAWAQHDDAHIRWIVRENLKKARLQKMDAAWVAAMRALV